MSQEELDKFMEEAKIVNRHWTLFWAMSELIGVVEDEGYTVGEVSHLIPGTKIPDMNFFIIMKSKKYDEFRKINPESLEDYTDLLKQMADICVPAYSMELFSDDPMKGIPNGADPRYYKEPTNHFKYVQKIFDVIYEWRLEHGIMELPYEAYFECSAKALAILREEYLEEQKRKTPKELKKIFEPESKA